MGQKERLIGKIQLSHCGQEKLHQLLCSETKQVTDNIEEKRSPIEGFGSSLFSLNCKQLSLHKVKETSPMLVWKRKFILAYSIKACICVQRGCYFIWYLCANEKKAASPSRQDTAQGASPGQVFNKNVVCETIILSNNS